jgi:hypothetical protein
MGPIQISSPAAMSATAKKNSALRIGSPLCPHEHFAIDAVGLTHAVEHSQQCRRPHVVFAFSRNGASLQTIGLAQALGRDGVM